MRWYSWLRVRNVSFSRGGYRLADSRRAAALSTGSGTKCCGVGLVGDWGWRAKGCILQCSLHQSSYIVSAFRLLSFLSGLVTQQSARETVQRFQLASGSCGMGRWTMAMETAGSPLRQGCRKFGRFAAGWNDLRPWYLERQTVVSMHDRHGAAANLKPDHITSCRWCTATITSGTGFRGKPFLAR